MGIMYNPISNVYKRIPALLEGGSCNNIVVSRVKVPNSAVVNVDKDMVPGGIHVNASMINTNPYQLFEISKYNHLLIAHLSVNDFDQGWLTDGQGWLTDLALGFEKETKSSLLTVATYMFYVKNIKDVKSVIDNQETIGAYILMIAYLNALTNGEFNYKAFIKDVKFLSGTVLQRFPDSVELKEAFGNANYVISKALTNSIDFYHRFKISEGEVIATSDEYNYKDSKGEFTAIDTHLMQKLLDLGCFTCDEKAIAENNDSVITEKNQLEFHLDTIGDNLKKILKYIVKKALELEKDQRQERLDAYERMREKFGDKWEIFIKTLTAETAELQQTSPSKSVNNATVEKEATPKKSV